MTEQPKIKKYRRKVSDERVQRAAISMVRASVDYIDVNFKMTLIEAEKQFNQIEEKRKLFYLHMAKAAFEADAEVIEATYIDAENGMGWHWLKVIKENSHNDGKPDYYRYGTIEELRPEWEEIE